MIARLAIIALLFLAAFQGERTPDDWFRMAVQCQQEQARLDSDDRRFLRTLVNQLSVDENAYPTPPQQRWLLDIKRRLDLDR